jgi:membrane-associated protease RseP (regulator of RpoE activity)
MGNPDFPMFSDFRPVTVRVFIIRALDRGGLPLARQNLEQGVLESTMATVIVFAFVISILVVVHELGHHLMAKWFGVPVDVFSVGFGPKLFAIRRGGTEYRVSAIPFGGYVKMAGTSPRGESVPNGFDSKTRWQRFLILLAGPVMNIGFALALAIVGLWVGIEVPAQSGSGTVIYRAEPIDAILLGGRAIAGSSAEILSTIGGLLTGDISLSHLIGPVGLAQIAGESSQLGWRAMLAAMAFISLNLGLCNLLPIPILDGGHMLMLLVEGIARRNVPFRARKALLGAGAAAMLLLLMTTFYYDLGRLGLLNP